jgi:diguanylate cyclase
VSEVLDSAAVQHLAAQLGLDAAGVAALEALGLVLAEGAPEALQAARGESALASAASPFFLPLLHAGMSEPQRALVGALARGALSGGALAELLVDWAGTLNPEEPAERAQRDVLPLQALMRSGALRAYADDPARCEAALAAAEALAATQLALLAEAAARAPHARGGAPGLAAFGAALEAALGPAGGAARPLAVLYVDCGIVGRIDDLWGYAAGDGARERLAARLRTEVLRPQDLLGEPGRDEFACVLRGVQGAGVATLAAEKTLRSLDQPLWVDVEEIHPRPVVGIALSPEHGASGAELLQAARAAARSARERPERYAVYAAGLEASDAALLVYESRLRAAVAQDALDIVFEPQRDLGTGLLVGAESRLRWRDGGLGAVPLERALAVAESAGLANEVTLWQVNGALRNCRGFRDAAGLDLRIGVKLAARSLCQTDLPDFVASALKTWNLRPSRLALQITGTAILAKSLESVETLKRLREAGVRLVLDDAGAGYAALAWLATLPFHELRVDLAAVGDVVESPPHLALVRALTDLAHRLKMEILVAGVEDEASAEKLRVIGCDTLQGPWVSKPLEAAALIETFRES